MHRGFFLFFFVGIKLFPGILKKLLKEKLPKKRKKKWQRKTSSEDVLF